MAQAAGVYSDGNGTRCVDLEFKGLGQLEKSLRRFSAFLMLA